MSELKIEGGAPITGTLDVPGNKNAALPMIAAAILTSEQVILRNVPIIKDVLTMLKILEDVGAEVSVDEKAHIVSIKAANINKCILSEELCKDARSSILFAGPMSARFGEVKLYPPGGDVIGKRRLDTHLDGFKSLGIDFSSDNNVFTFTQKAFAGTDLVLDEASVTATENIVMAAVFAPGRTTIFNAACEPHVMDLCNLLKAMGADISGVGTNYLIINGVKELHGAEFDVSSDYIYAASFMAASLATGGELTVNNIEPMHFKILGKQLFKLGVKWKISDNSIYIPGNQQLCVRKDFGDSIPKIDDGIWPAFPSDVMSVAIVLATQVQGTVLFFEKMFESRMYFVDRLITMGAQIVQCDPHRIVVSGPAKLRATCMSSPDIRAGIALVIAALTAEGTSYIGNAECIDRGYENVEEQLKQLGARITRIQ
ncbi:MAG: UDP-N-acetylglucosamine 1-carboxyvinyltransferase [Kiritimatiellae bacterium]|jgi:UDP-N-acetylglucosamine 1-carboxyvinyltransferase|nr:UDP-N-acetylglucosamine 1-carboxyvinyltransferase [Kiritimatiellia bacterium]